MVNTDTPSAQCPQIPANDHQISTFYTLSSERNARLSLRNAIELNKTKNQIMRSETLKQIKIIDISLSFLPSIHSFFCHSVWSADMIMTSSGQSVLTSRDWLTPGSSSRHSPPQSDTESPEPPICRPLDSLPVATRPSWLPMQRWALMMVPWSMSVRPGVRTWGQWESCDRSRRQSVPGQRLTSSHLSHPQEHHPHHPPKNTSSKAKEVIK